jgi:hypothetical protein
VRGAREWISIEVRSLQLSEQLTTLKPLQSMSQEFYHVIAVTYKDAPVPLIQMTLTLREMTQHPAAGAWATA